MHRHLRILATSACLLGLSACGAEMASTAAAVGRLQATQTERAQADQARIPAGLKQAEQATTARAASAGGLSQ
jgi:hypothetical protein